VFVPSGSVVVNLTNYSRVGASGGIGFSGAGELKPTATSFAFFAHQVECFDKLLQLEGSVTASSRRALVSGFC